MALWASIRSAIGSIVVFAGGPLLLLCLSAIHLTQGAVDIGFGEVLNALFSPDGTSSDDIVRHLWLPRLADGMLAGASLAVSGVPLQSVTRNPLASPTILGVSSGAYFALVATTVFVPGVLGFSPVLIAFAGGVAAAWLAYAIAGAAGATPVRLALAGVAVSLVFAALTDALQLFYENETAGLFFWGSGSLLQDGWSDARYAWPRVALGLLFTLALGRSLDVLALSDDMASSLGQRVRLTRSVGLLAGIFMAAVAVSVAGPIGFVGLIIPHIVRLLSVRRHLYLLVGSAIWGAVLLVGADVLAMVLTTGFEELPAGAMTGLLGAPYFIWLARRVAVTRGSRMPSRNTQLRVASRRQIPYPLLVGGISLVLVLMIVVGSLVGDVMLSPPAIVDTVRGSGTALSEKVLWELRAPRLLVAVLAGSALAVSGALLQSVARNPLAGPEIVGVTNGAGLAALIVLVLIPGVPFAAVPVAALAGGVIAFAVVYAVAWRDGLTATRLALVGVADSAFCAAGITILVLRAKLAVAQALVWLSGSTYARGWDDLARLAPWLAVSLPVAWLIARHLDILAVGDDPASGLGMRVERVRLIALGTGVALAAAAVSVVGTIGFVGLIGPHSARLLLGGRQQHRQLLVVTALCGATLLVIADTTGRTVLAPKEIPSGLVTALIGAPYFLWLLQRSRTT